MIERIEKTLDTLSEWLAQLAALTLWVFTGFVVLSSFMRYFLGRPFNFTEELVGLLFLAATFLVFPYATSRREHINIPLLVDALPPRPRLVSDIIAGLVMVIFGAWFTYKSWQFAAFSFQIDARSEQLLIPVAPWQMTMPLGMGLMTIIATVQLLRRIGAGVRQRVPPHGTNVEPL